MIHLRRRRRRDGRRGVHGQLQQIRVDRQRDLVPAADRYVLEAVIAVGQHLFVQHRRRADLGLRKARRACRSGLQQAPHRRGHDDVVARRICHCYRAARNDDGSFDRHVAQRYRVRTEALRDEQIALDRRIGQRTALRNGSVRRIPTQVGARIGLSGSRKRGSEVIIDDLRDLAARYLAGRTEGAVAVAGKEALVDRRSDVAGRPARDLRPVLEVEARRGHIARVGLVQAADDGRGLLARHGAGRVHSAAAHAVDVAVFLRDAHGLIVPRALRHVGVADGGRFREVERAVDVAHELGTGHLCIRLVFAGRRGGVDDVLIRKIVDIFFRPVAVQIGRREGRRHKGQQQDGAQQSGEQSFSHHKHLF